MEFIYAQGGPIPPPQAISIYCVDAETLSIPMDPITVGLKDSATWLTLSATNGNTPYESLVSVDPSGLAPGSYFATIGIASTSEEIANSTDQLPVNLTVTAGPVPEPPSVNVPTITFKTPDNTQFKTNNKEFEVRVSDPVGVVAVSLFVNDSKTAITCQGVHKQGARLPATVQLQWMESSIPRGSYLLTAVAHNALGGTAKAQITVKRI